jgi:voltage-gated potassium channel Kch
MARFHDEWRHLALLISILLLFLVTPLLAFFPHAALVLNCTAATVLATGSYALMKRIRLFVIALVLSGISILATWLMLTTHDHRAALLSHACIIVLITFFSITTLGYVLQGTRVTADKIFAAICVYMLMGFAWTFIYALLDELQPGSFVSLSTTATNDYVAHYIEMRYFSFVTLTTVGYGDIVPHSPATRTLAALEAVAGQIYLTVLVARLVGLHIVHARKTSSGEE